MERPLRPWLLRIAANQARNQRRSAGRYFAALTRLARGEVAGWHGAADIAAESERRTDAQALWRAVRRLSDDDQRIIYLRHFLELSVEETAQALGIPPGTVKSRLHRALGRLRSIIEVDFPMLRVGGGS